MAAPTYFDGPDLHGFTGHMDLGGFSGNVQYGRAAFVTTAQTADIPLKSGGLTRPPLVFLNYNESNITLTWAIDSTGTKLTVTRSSTTSTTATASTPAVGEFDYLLIYLT